MSNPRDDRGVRLADVRLPRWWPLSLMGALLLRMTTDSASSRPIRAAWRSCRPPSRNM
jgi:hypothetical protein